MKTTFYILILWSTLLIMSCSSSKKLDISGIYIWEDKRSISFSEPQKLIIDISDKNIFFMKYYGLIGTGFLFCKKGKIKKIDNQLKYKIQDSYTISLNTGICVAESKNINQFETLEFVRDSSILVSLEIKENIFSQNRLDSITYIRDYVLSKTDSIINTNWAKKPQSLD